MGTDPEGLYVKQAVISAGDFIGIKDAEEWMGNVAAFWTGYATDDATLMSLWEAGMRDSLGRLANPEAFIMNRVNKVGKAGNGAMNLFWGATKANYAKNFWKAAWEKIEWYQVHHSLPQKYVKQFEEIGINIHENKYLRWVYNETHRKITNEWDKFDRWLNWSPTVSQIKEFAKDIDKRYRQDFIFTK